MFEAADYALGNAFRLWSNFLLAVLDFQSIQSLAKRSGCLPDTEQDMGDRKVQISLGKAVVQDGDGAENKTCALLPS